MLSRRGTAAVSFSNPSPSKNLVIVGGVFRFVLPAIVEFGSLPFPCVVRRRNDQASFSWTVDSVP
jgi:hypothetical protein